MTIKVQQNSSRSQKSDFKKFLENYSTAAKSNKNSHLRVPSNSQSDLQGRLKDHRFSSKVFGSFEPGKFTKPRNRGSLESFQSIRGLYTTSHANNVKPKTKDSSFFQARRPTAYESKPQIVPPLEFVSKQPQTFRTVGVHEMWNRKNYQENSLSIMTKKFGLESSPQINLWKRFQKRHGSPQRIEPEQTIYKTFYKSPAVTRLSNKFAYLTRN